MTTIHVLALAFSAIGFPVFLLSKKKNVPGQHNWLEQLKLDRNPYQSLRLLAITTPPYKYTRIQSEKVFGMVMDYPVKNGTATLVSYITGETSLYVSNGSGVINGHRHTHIHDQAIRLVESSASQLPLMLATSRYPMPVAGSVRFYLLTTEGVHTAEVLMSDVEQGASSFTGLFNEANELIRDLQLTTFLN